LSDEDLLNMVNTPSYTPFARRVASEEVSRRKRTKATQEVSPEFVMPDPGAFRNETSEYKRAGCYIELWSDKEFEGECLRIEGPVECQAVESEVLEWGDSISSLRVGPSGFVLVYAEKNFKGAMMSFGPGQEVADLEVLSFDDEIDSLRLVDSMRVFEELRAQDANKPVGEASPEKKRNKKAGRSKSRELRLSRTRAD
jgi:hypothetical protein